MLNRLYISTYFFSPINQNRNILLNFIAPEWICTANRVAFYGDRGAKETIARTYRVNAIQTAISPICHYATRVAVTRNIISAIVCYTGEEFAYVTKGFSGTMGKVLGEGIGCKTRGKGGGSAAQAPKGRWRQIDRSANPHEYVLFGKQRLNQYFV